MTDDLRREADKHYLFTIHAFGMNADQRDKFMERISDEAFRYEEDEILVVGGPCTEGSECHGEDVSERSRLDG